MKGLHECFSESIQLGNISTELLHSIGKGSVLSQQTFLLLDRPGEFVGCFGERGVEGLDLSFQVGDEVVLLGGFLPETGRLGFELGDTCREGDGGDLAGHIELLERVCGEDRQKRVG